MTIRLASTSPTRLKLLLDCGLSLAATDSKVDERALVAANPAWPPAQTAQHLAQAKAESVSARHPADVVIGADQVLSFQNRMFSKAMSREHCRQQLLELRGRDHHLISSVCCVRGGHLIWAHTDTATLTMRHFTDQFLDVYLEAIGSDCLTTVGGYKIESRGIQLFEKIIGDHFTILGLPLLPLLSFLRSANAIPQ